MDSSRLQETTPDAMLRDLATARIALVHYWYVRRGGGELVLDVLAEMFPQADIFCLVADPSLMPPATRSHKLTTSFMDRLPGGRRHYRKLMALMPLALEGFRLDDYDIVISHEAGPSKGVLTRARTLHVNYSHSPIRYVWEMYHDYVDDAPGGALGRLVFKLSSHYMRLWDYAAAGRVDRFVASSRNGAERIAKYYRRESDVIYPPVNLSSCKAASERDDFYLIVSRLVPYKRIDLAIQACNALGRQLVIIGDGFQRRELAAMAGPTVKLLGRQPDEVVFDHYARCRAFLLPGEEDIGLTPIEAQASGAPVIAYGAGGVLETVRGVIAGQDVDPGTTGVFFLEKTSAALQQAILAFEAQESRLSRADLVAQAARFSTEEFKLKFSAMVARYYAEYRSRNLLPRGTASEAVRNR